MVGGGLAVGAVGAVSFAAWYAGAPSLAGDGSSALVWLACLVPVAVYAAWWRFMSVPIDADASHEAPSYLSVEERIERIERIFDEAATPRRPGGVGFEMEQQRRVALTSTIRRPTGTGGPDRRAFGVRPPMRDEPRATGRSQDAG